jgi:AcrR family transcriptional regulator
VTRPPEKQARSRPPRSRRSGRRAGDSGTRAAILAAARARFGEVGYDRATIRGIATEAGVDPALVHHFFGTKERLFAAVMQLPVVPGEVVAAALAPGAREPGRGLGEHLVRTVLGIWEVAEIRDTFLGLLRTLGSSEPAGVMMREFIAENILGRVALAAREAGAADDAEAEFRAALVGSQILGLGLARYLLQLGPLAEASPDELTAAIGPTVERYLTGSIT